MFLFRTDDVRVLAICSIWKTSRAKLALVTESINSPLKCSFNKHNFCTMRLVEYRNVPGTCTCTRSCTLTVVGLKCSPIRHVRSVPCDVVRDSWSPAETAEHRFPVLHRIDDRVSRSPHDHCHHQHENTHCQERDHSCNSTIHNASSVQLYLYFSNS